MGVGVVPHEIVRDRELDGGLLREVVVRIPYPVNEDEVRRLADAVKYSGGRPYPKLSIAVVLPGMEPGRDAWATAMFGTDLEVHILGDPARDP